MTVIKEVLVEGSATQHIPIDNVLCEHSDALRCRNKSIESKKSCNSYECPYHPFDINDHWG